MTEAIVKSQQCLNVYSSFLQCIYIYLQICPTPFLLKVILKVRITKISTNSEDLKGTSTVSWTDNKCYLQDFPLCCQQNRNSSYVASFIWWLVLLSQYAHLIFNTDCAIFIFVTPMWLYNVVLQDFYISSSIWMPYRPAVSFSGK